MERVELTLRKGMYDELGKEIDEHDISLPEYIRYIISIRHERDELKRDLEQTSSRIDELQRQLREANARNEKLEGDLADFEQGVSGEHPSNGTEPPALSGPPAEADSPDNADEPDGANESGEVDGKDTVDGATEAKGIDDQGSDDELANCAAQLRSYLG